MTYEADMMVLKKIGVETTVPDSGCCGLAGSSVLKKAKSMLFR